MIVFFNNHIIDEKSVHVAPTDRGFTLGDGVFDTLLCVDGKPRHAREHFTRLLAHAAFLGIKPEHTPEFLEQTAITLLKKNRFLGGRHALRTMVTRGLRIPKTSMIIETSCTHGAHPIHQLMMSIVSRVIVQSRRSARRGPPRYARRFRAASVRTRRVRATR